MLRQGIPSILLCYLFVVTCFSNSDAFFVATSTRHPGIDKRLCLRSSNLSQQIYSGIVNGKQRKCRSNSLCMIQNPNDDDDDDDEEGDGGGGMTASNVLGTELCPCCTDVRDTGIGTGFYRNGYCATGENDVGRHTVCVQVSDTFLQFSKQVGNDLSTPAPEYMFPGLQDGDIWCLCAQRWVQAYNAGMAPKLYLQATHEKTLSFVPYEILQQYAIDQTEASDALDKLNRVRDQLNKLL
jgi:uncharacterized protein